MSLSLPLSPFWAKPRHSPWRLLMATAAVIAALAHIPVTGEHLQEAPYMGVLFILLTIACLTLAAIALVRDPAAVYAASTVVCALAVIGYAATRIVPFPMLADDVGNWLEPLGVLSVISELTVIISAQLALHTRRAAPVGASGTTGQRG